jgi:hypothetical protein
MLSTPEIYKRLLVVQLMHLEFQRILTSTSIAALEGAEVMEKNSKRDS